MIASAKFNEDITKTGVRLAIAVTGGGMTGVTDLFRFPGSSAFLETFTVPYGMDSFKKLAGEVEHFVSEKATRQMARGLFAQTWPDGFLDKTLTSIAVSSKLTTAGEREGRAHKVIATAYNPIWGFVTRELNPMGATRSEQEAEAASFVLSFIYNTCTSPK